MSHKLSCHCGAVELKVELLDGLETARRCDCSFCRRRGAAAVTVPLGGIKIIKGEDNLTRYQWNTNTAKHYFCKTCGIYTHHHVARTLMNSGSTSGHLKMLTPETWATLAG